MVRKFVRCAKPYWNQGAFTVAKYRIRFDQASVAGKDHLWRRRIVAHPHSLQHACDDTYQFLLSKRFIEVSMRARQRFAFENICNDLAWLCNLASIHPLPNKFMKL
ncbi:hypothetical protein CK224_05065 [Mesorhizobium sp. WSM3862]|nr:hypothetical protein CK224_05065 [Mesorhizobium sp. WSM3862]